MSLACEIDMYVSGEASDIGAFNSVFIRPEQEPGFGGQMMTDFGRIVPEPFGASDEELAGWRRENWGPRSDGWDVETDASRQGIGYHFWVKDGEPTAVVVRASEMYPSLRFEYAYSFEDGSDQDSSEYVGGKRQ